MSPSLPSAAAANGFMREAAGKQDGVGPRLRASQKFFRNERETRFALIGAASTATFCVGQTSAVPNFSLFVVRGSKLAVRVSWVVTLPAARDELDRGMGCGASSPSVPGAERVPSFALKSEAIRVFRMVDTDNSGHLNVDEFKKTLPRPQLNRAVGLGSTSTFNIENAMGDAMASAAFDLFDENHSGVSVLRLLAQAHFSANLTNVTNVSLSVSLSVSHCLYCTVRTCKPVTA